MARRILLEPAHGIVTQTSELIRTHEACPRDPNPMLFRIERLINYIPGVCAAVQNAPTSERPKCEQGVVQSVINALRDAKQDGRRI